MEKEIRTIEDTDQPIIIRAIEIFKERYGIKTPLTLFEMDEIITELKEEAKITKKEKK